MKLRYFSVLLCSLFISQPSIAEERYVNYDVIQNSANEQCQFAFEVLLDVEYFSEGSADERVVLTAFNGDGQPSYSETRDIEGEKGSFLWSFDAGFCTSHIQFSFQ